jgi:hypothetical protein
MPQHPEPHIRRAIRVLAIVGELHKRGYQRLRVMPCMSPSGVHWRCLIGPVTLFYRNHGAILNEMAAGLDNDEIQEVATIARYTSAQTNQYFGWKDAQTDDVRSLADKFVKRFRTVADSGRGWNYHYAGWYQRLLGLAEAGWLPVVLRDYVEVVYDHIPLDDVRPREWQVPQGQTPTLPNPPPGELQQDYRG